jgi:hypothetical protein
MPNGNVKVRLSGRTVGEIMGDSDEGFYYKPIGSKTSGDWFKTLREAKASLES